MFRAFRTSRQAVGHYIPSSLKRVMALSGTGKLEDTAKLLTEMISVFESDDAAVIPEIHKKQGDCVKLCEKRQADAKRTVKGASFFQAAQS